MNYRHGHNTREATAEFRRGCTRRTKIRMMFEPVIARQGFGVMESSVKLLELAKEKQMSIPIKTLIRLRRNVKSMLRERNERKKDYERTTS